MGYIFDVNGTHDSLVVGRHVHIQTVDHFQLHFSSGTSEKPFAPRSVRLCVPATPCQTRFSKTLCSGVLSGVDCKPNKEMLYDFGRRRPLDGLHLNDLELS